MPPPPPPPPPMPFRDRRDIPSDPLDSRRRQYHHNRREQEPGATGQQQWEQEAADEALALHLQQQEIDGGLGVGDLHILDPERENDTGSARRRERAARRERRGQLVMDEQ